MAPPTRGLAAVSVIAPLKSGMRWTQAMAEAVVKFRALYLSGDFDAYWDFHITEDQQRLHPPGSTGEPENTIGKTADVTGIDAEIQQLF
jgi:hypothetical protein